MFSGATYALNERKRGFCEIGGVLTKLTSYGKYHLKKLYLI